MHEYLIDSTLANIEARTIEHNIEAAIFAEIYYSNTAHDLDLRKNTIALAIDREYAEISKEQDAQSSEDQLENWDWSDKIENTAL